MGSGYAITELRLRRHLTTLGWSGVDARFRELELVAVERPGWVQFFEFDVSIERLPEDADDDPETVRLVGVCRDDERFTTEVRLASSAEDLDEILADWAANAIRPQRRIDREQASRAFDRASTVLVVVFALSIALALIVTVRRSVNGPVNDVSKPVDAIGVEAREAIR